MKLFYYTDIEIKSNEEGRKEIRKNGYSFDMDSVIMTYPEKDGLAVILNRNADKLNPTDYQYKINPVTKQKEPVKITKFETTSEPIVVVIKDQREIEAFFHATGGPEGLTEVAETL
jgi:DNA modification methylase